MIKFKLNQERKEAGGASPAAPGSPGSPGAPAEAKKTKAALLRIQKGTLHASPLFA